MSNDSLISKVDATRPVLATAPLKPGFERSQLSKFSDHSWDLSAAVGIVAGKIQYKHASIGRFAMCQATVRRNCRVVSLHGMPPEPDGTIGAVVEPNSYDCFFDPATALCLISSKNQGFNEHPDKAQCQ
jgi:hypothetical protein